MKCPNCGYNEDRVLDTREQREGQAIRRRRECLKCKTRFSTTEVLNVCYPLIIKKDGRREPFTKDKIFKGLQAACQKRTISLAQIEGIVEKIANWIVQRGEKEIPSKLVGKKVMIELRKLDDVAYIRFASVYRNFQDVQEFVETLEDEEFVESYEFSTQLQLAPEPLYDVESTPNETSIKRTRTPDPISN